MEQNKQITELMAKFLKLNTEKFSKIIYNMDLVERVKSNFTSSQLKLLFECIDKELSIFHMMNIHEAMIDGLSNKQIKLLMREGLDINQVLEIRTALTDGLDYECVKLICNPNIPCDDMERLHKILLYFQRFCNKNNIHDVRIEIIKPNEFMCGYDILFLYKNIKEDDGNYENWIYHYDIGHLPYEVFLEKLKDGNNNFKYVDGLLTLSGSNPDCK